MNTARTKLNLLESRRVTPMILAGAISLISWMFAPVASTGAEAIRNGSRTGGEVHATLAASVSTIAREERALSEYRAELAKFRAEYGGARKMPAVSFFQFGMGLRTKYLFKDGKLLEARDGKVFRNWDATGCVIVPCDYMVSFIKTDGGKARIFEDQAGVWIEENGQKSPVPGTTTPVKLPDFAGHPYSSILRVLHHEILMNVALAGPVPNIFVYKKPWYRDGALMAMCLKETGNLDQIRDWILGLNEVFDRNNAGETEADNPGQAMFLISLVSDRKHPLVPALLEALKKFEVRDQHGLYIRGRSDFSERPVYQTKWAKFGLRSLGFPDPYIIPPISDSYSSLFWMDYRDKHVEGGEAIDRNMYPYLGWATDHFQGKKLSPISDRDYPLTWEIQASQAAYAGMAVIDPIFEHERISVPHTWHAAEIFLYLLDGSAKSIRDAK